ncbi:MAG: N-6 DNA methylase [Anaerolineales bacterium]
MQTITRNPFVTVRTEGGLLPSDLLLRIVEGNLDGQHPEDYGLKRTDRLNEGISRAWADCRDAWARFQAERAALPESDTGTTFTRERWLYPLLRALGYQDGPAEERLAYVGSLVANDESYPISHVAGRLPVHLVTFRQDLDRRSPVDTVVRRSPHAIMQEFLNRADGYLWGIIANGLSLRLLRDNAALTRQAYVEFDLAAMFEGEQYADFALLWLVCHHTRAAGSDPAAFWLEHWRQQATESGARALDSLRDGVERAITALGSGFIARRNGHLLNQSLTARLRSGALSAQDYYWQVLRLVYRLIFVFVAEDRDLLHPPEASPAARQRYAAYYSTARLRQIARQTRGDVHTDAYRGLQLVLHLLRGDDGDEQARQGRAGLGLPALGGYLFGPEAAPDLDGASPAQAPELPNSALYQAVRELAYTQYEGVPRPVDYRNLGAVELGSVYESLLEMHPSIDLDAGLFSLGAVSGSERKTTGSYYTPAELVNSLVETALEPVLAERIADARRGGAGPAAVEKAILSLRVVDPACGSGHFLLAAAHRLARELAATRAAGEEPTVSAYRTALRDVVAHCIHGVDLNPMAVELCKIALWLETLDPGRPLGFLDANIVCGNSLLGATPALLARGIPDEAFDPIVGDDRAVARAWKKANREAHEDGADGRLRLFDPDTYASWQHLGELGSALVTLLESEEHTPGDVQAKEELYRDYVHGLPYANARLWADAWCAAFVMEKSNRWDYGLTERRFCELQASPYAVAGWLKDDIERLAGVYRFFHWHLAFPNVFHPLPPDKIAPDDPCGWGGGFDVVLGNPPWERIKLQQIEFFAARDETVAAAPNKAARERLIDDLQTTNPPLYAAYREALRVAEGYSHLLRHSGRYPLCGRGDVNTYALFAELARHLTAPTGRAGIIVPSGIATDDTTKEFFGDVITRGSLVSLYDFENRQGIFAGIHRSYKFSLLTLCGGLRSAPAAEFAFFCQSIADLADAERRFTLSPADIALLNPNTRTCPIFRSRRDAALTTAIYRRVPILIRERDDATGTPEVNPWGISFLRMFDMSNDSALFRTRAQLEAEGYRLAGNVFVQRPGAPTPERYLPLYEGKMVHQFDHRWAGWGAVDSLGRAVGGGRTGGEEGAAELALAQKQDPATLPLPRYWVPEEEVATRLAGSQARWLLGFRDITNSTNERTAIFGVMPRVAVGHKAQLLFMNRVLPGLRLCALSCMNSFALDYVVRQKVGGTSMTYHYVKQFPVLPPSAYGPAERAFIVPRALELVYTAWDLAPFAQEVEGAPRPPFRWDEARRFQLRAELDALFFHLYGIAREDVAYIMGTFPIVQRKDVAAYGCYRTQEAILAVYDQLAALGGHWDQYVSPLDPPPGDVRARHGEETRPSWA